MYLCNSCMVVFVGLLKMYLCKRPWAWPASSKVWAAATLLQCLSSRPRKQSWSKMQICAKSFTITLNFLCKDLQLFSQIHSAFDANTIKGAIIITLVQMKTTHCCKIWIALQIQIHTVVQIYYNIYLNGRCLSACLSVCMSVTFWPLFLHTPRGHLLNLYPRKGLKFNNDQDHCGGSPRSRVD